MICMAIAWDSSGRIVQKVDWFVRYDAQGVPIELVDFEEREEIGSLLDIWQPVAHAAGVGTWPEWLNGEQMDQFEVDLAPAGVHRVRELVHVGRGPKFNGETILPAVPGSGFRRRRATIKAVIAERVAVRQAEANAIRASLPQLRDPDGRFLPRPEVLPEPADIRDLVGGPDHPLVLDDTGRRPGSE